MIVVLDDSLVSILHNDQNSIYGLESVLTSSWNGEHFFTSSFIVVNSLLKLPLSQKSKAVLQRLRQNIARHGGLPYPNSFVITITLGGAITKASPRRWIVPVSTFRNMTFPPSVVLGENMLDAKAYLAAALQARFKHKIPGHSRALPDAGGGSQTTTKLNGYLQHKNGFCFCITDGDYQEPQGAKSAVTTACQHAVTTTTWPSFATDFGARAIENIMPIDFIEEAYAPQPIPNEFHDFKRIHDVDVETTRYINTKEGLKNCDVTKMTNGSRKQLFWNSKLVKHGLHAKSLALTANPPQCTGNGCSGCSLIKGLGDGTLKRVVKYLETSSPNKLAQKVSLNSIWCEIGESVFHWTMSDKPILS